MDAYQKGPDRRITSNILLTIITIIIAGFVLRFARSVFIPLLIAVFIAYVMDPLVTLLRRIRVPLIVAVLLAGFMFLGVVLWFSYVLVSNTQNFAVTFPRYQSAFVNLVRDLLSRIQFAADNLLGVQLLDEIRKIPVASIVLSTIQSVAGLVTEFFMVFVFSLLFLFAKHGFTRKLIRSFPRPEAKKIARVLQKIDSDLRKYIGIKSFVSALVGLGTGVVLSLFHLEFAVIIGFLTFVLNFIPYLGSIIAVIVPLLLSIIQFGSWVTTLWIFIALLLIQNLIAQVLEPALVGIRLKISIPMVFVALFFWGWLWGAPGVLLAVPMTTSIKLIMEDIPGFRSFSLLLERAPRRPSPKPASARKRSKGRDRDRGSGPGADSASEPRRTSDQTRTAEKTPGADQDTGSPA
ncbi:MAG: AI-2E family transporter [Spirochaetales bacterium]|nr:AI-2E family transporter [Spirochaetales bacterium]